MSTAIESTLCSSFVEALCVSGASVSVFGQGGQHSTVCVSDTLAAALDSLQFALGEGPRWQSLSDGEPVLCPDLSSAANTAWPTFSVAASELEVASVFAFPMKLGAATVGVVDLYGMTPLRLDAHHISIATSMANRVAAIAVRRATQAAHSEHDATASPAMRREVHQATGMIQAQLNTTATDAFARLRGHAFASGQPIEAVAREVVARRLNFAELSD